MQTFVQYMKERKRNAQFRKDMGFEWPHEHVSSFYRTMQYYSRLAVWALWIIASTLILLIVHLFQTP